MQKAAAQLSQAVRPPSGAGPRAARDGVLESVWGVEREVAFSRSGVGVGVEGLLGDVVVVIGDDMMGNSDGVGLGNGLVYFSWGG